MRPPPRPSPEGEGDSEAEGASIISISNGAAKAHLQKALATGPVSDRRTRMGAKAIAHPPASRQMKAIRLMGGGYHSAHMPSEFLSAVILLTLVVDPFGNVPLVNAMLSGVPSPRRRAVILRECAIAFAILLGFMLSGRAVLDLMRLSESSLSIAGGVILFMIAIRMVFAHPEGALGAQPGGEPLIVPLAVPLIAGPSALATVMLMATRDPEKLGMWIAALTATMALATVVLA